MTDQVYTCKILVWQTAIRTVQGLACQSFRSSVKQFYAKEIQNETLAL